MKFLEQMLIKNIFEVLCWFTFISSAEMVLIKTNLVRKQSRRRNWNLFLTLLVTTIFSTPSKRGSHSSTSLYTGPYTLTLASDSPTRLCVTRNRDYKPITKIFMGKEKDIDDFEI